MKMVALLAVVAAAMVATAPAYAQDRLHPKVIVLRHATLLDGVHAQPQRDVAITVRDGRISNVHRDHEGRADAADSVIDLQGAWVMPGLIDAHVHVGYTDSPEGIGAPKAALEAGVTTLRSLGFTPAYGDVALKQRFLSGDATVPRVLAASQPLLPVVGEGWLRDLPTLRSLLQPAAPADSVLMLEPGPGWRLTGNDAAIDSAVGVLKEHGDDWIKVFASGRAGLDNSNPLIPFLSEHDMHTAVIAAGKRGLSVAAHAHSDAAIRAAVLAGARTIEHGTYASAATLKMMKQKRTCYAPTLSAWTRHAMSSDSVQAARAATMRPVVMVAVREAHNLGVQIIAGTDSDYSPGSPHIASELLALTEAGLSPDEALRAATSQSAKCLGLEEEAGSIAPGRSAELLVLSGDPRDDLMRLDKPLMVMLRGRVVVDRR